MTQHGTPSDSRRALPQRRFAETFELDHGQFKISVTIGHYPDGTIGEVFVHGAKTGSDLDASVRDGAILASLALQHGVPLNTMASAITREADGQPSTVIGRVLDRLMREKSE